jgi:hypothetical protein
MRQFNERPSNHANLGHDIQGAARHHHDTYNNPEVKRAREFKASSAKAIKAAKAKAQSLLTEANFVLVINSFEFEKLLLSHDGFTGFDDNKTELIERISDLKAYVISKRGSEGFNKLADKFNRFNRLVSRNRWRIRSLEEAQAYFGKKTSNKFQEFNGHKSPWSSEEPQDLTKAKAYLLESVGAVQFGNSVPDLEREYCLSNLSQSISLLSELLSFDFKAVGFSFGARGKAGSIAHYQDSNKVIAINRHWDGALIHEIGHAIDYSMNKVSYSIPTSIINKYSAQLTANKISKKSYYMKRVEIFARLFEVYIRAQQPETSSFAQSTFNQQVMPELDAEALAYMTEALKPLLKGSNT